MGKLTYNGQCWEGHDETVSVRMNDATFQKHLNAYLESIGVTAQTWLQLQDYVQRVCEQRYQAMQHMANLEGWRDCVASTPGKLTLLSDAHSNALSSCCQLQ